MKSEKGITLTSLIIYIIVMMIVIGTVTVMTKYFYNNLDFITGETEGSKEYTSFNTFITDEINRKNNDIIDWKVIKDGEDNVESGYLIFANEHQYTYNKSSESIYINKVLICKNVSDCSFDYEGNARKLTVEMKIGKREYKNVYTLEREE